MLKKKKVRQKQGNSQRMRRRKTVPDVKRGRIGEKGTRKGREGDTERERSRNIKGGEIRGKQTGSERYTKRNGQTHKADWVRKKTRDKL